MVHLYISGTSIGSFSLLPFMRVLFNAEYPAYQGLMVAPAIVECVAKQLAVD